MRAKRLWLLALAALTLSQRVDAQPAVNWQPQTAAPSSPPAGTPAWKPTANQASTSAQQLQWAVVTPAASHTDSHSVTWEPLPSDSAAVASDAAPASPPRQPPQNQQEAMAALKALATEQPSGPTYANFRALWRDEEWLPQISSLVPVGFGPQGFMLSLYARGLDCGTGKGECPGFTSYSDWQKSTDLLGSGQIEQVIGFGDPIKAISVVFNNSSEKLAAQLQSGSLGTSSLFTGNQTGVAIVKAFGPDTSIRTGIDNLIRWDSNNTFYDPLSFYAVLSQRIRINDNRSPWFSSAYITAGIGNGDFRPIEQIFITQTEALRQAGCATYGYQPKKPCSQDTFNRAIQSGSNYGQINPIGSLGLEVYKGINLITEWTGRNLNLGISWRPIPSLGLVITPMVQSLVQNCEYAGCKVNVPNYNERVPLPSSVLTQRARLSLQASLEIKF